MLRPRFCPNRDCEYHDADHPRLHRVGTERWYARSGYYRSRVHGIVQRFRCRRCGTTCSERTFALDYYVKRRVSFLRVERCIISCSGVRAAARALGCSADTISNRVSRLARQYLAAHAQLLRGLSLQESVAADGFQSFAVSQFYPNNIHLLAGCESQFVYGCDYVTIRRAGTMTERQRRLREALEQLYRAPRDGINRSFRHLVRQLERLSHRSKCLPDILWTDLRGEYSQELSRNRTIRALMAAGRFEHRTVSSRRHRDVRNRLFAVNYLDREIRTGLAEHVRQTTRFARNVNNSMERLWVYLGAHNLRKPHRLNNPKADTTVHAQRAGISGRRIEAALSGLYTSRRFFSQHSLSQPAQTLWRRAYPTPLRGVPPNLLRRVRTLGAKRKIDVEAICAQLGISKPQTPRPECLPSYALG